MSETLQNTEQPINETPVATNAFQDPGPEPDPTCCRAPGDSDGGPDT